MSVCLAAVYLESLGKHDTAAQTTSLARKKIILSEMAIHTSSTPE